MNSKRNKAESTLKGQPISTQDVMSPSEPSNRSKSTSQSPKMNYKPELPSKDNIDRSFALFMPYFTIIHCGIATRHQAITPTPTSLKQLFEQYKARSPISRQGSFIRDRLGYK